VVNLPFDGRDDAHGCGKEGGEQRDPCRDPGGNRCHRGRAGNCRKGSGRDAEPVNKPTHPLAFGSLVFGFGLGIFTMASKRHIDLGP
jgi:hypothetical protein